MLTTANIWPGEALLRICETTNTKTFIRQTHIHKNINTQRLIPQRLNHQDFEQGNPLTIKDLSLKDLNIKDLNRAIPHLSIP